ncbi:Autophagy protein [Homalodisca vitripennis]|nr:Autophagy protein [Homalodisca vitripennis]
MGQQVSRSQLGHSSRVGQTLSRPTSKETSMLESMWSSMSSSIQMATECLKQSQPENQGNDAPVIEGVEKFAHIIDSLLRRMKVKFVDTLIRLEHLPKGSKTGVAMEINIKHLDYCDEAESDAQRAPDAEFNPSSGFTVSQIHMEGVSFYSDEFPAEARTVSRSLIVDSQGDETEPDISSKYESKPIIFAKLGGRQEIKVQMKREEIQGPKVQGPKKRVWAQIRRRQVSPRCAFDGQSEVEEQIWQQPFSVLNLLLKFAEPSSKLTHYSLIVPQLSVDGRVSENSHYERTECTRTTELGSLSSQWVARHTPSGRNVYYTLPAASNTIPVDIELNLGSLSVFLSPRQLHLLLELCHGIAAPDTQDTSNVARCLQKPMGPKEFERVEQQLLNELHPVTTRGLHTVQGWSSAPLDDSDEEFFPMAGNSHNLSDSMFSDATSLNASFSSSCSSFRSQSTENGKIVSDFHFDEQFRTSTLVPDATAGSDSLKSPSLQTRSAISMMSFLIFLQLKIHAPARCIIATTNQRPYSEPLNFWSEVTQEEDFVCEEKNSLTWLTLDARVDGDMGAEESRLHVKLSSLAVVLLHEDILILSPETGQITESSLQQMSRTADQFFSKLGLFAASGYGKKDFEYARKIFVEACHLNHIRLLGAPVIMEIEERYSQTSTVVGAVLTAASVELLECLVEKVASSLQPLVEYVEAVSHSGHTMSRDRRRVHTATDVYRYWDIVSALSVVLVEAGNMASGSWCDSAFTKNVPSLVDGDSSSSSEEELMLLYSFTNRTHWNYLLFCSSCSAILPHAVSFKLLSLYSSKSVFHSSGRVLTASINCSIINKKNCNPASCKELQHETARQPVCMREATEVDRCFEKIALGAVPQIRLSTSVVSVVSVRFWELLTFEEANPSREGASQWVSSQPDLRLQVKHTTKVRANMNARPRPPCTEIS